VTWAAPQGAGFAAINGDRTHARTGTSKITIYGWSIKVP